MYWRLNSNSNCYNNIQKAKDDINTQRYHQVSIIYMLTAFAQGPLATVTDPCPLQWAWHATQHNHSPIHTINFAKKEPDATYLIRHIHEL